MTTFRYITATAVLAGALLTSTAARADNERGRLPDGRAYRTDSGGNQLVDYIAELELSVDNLKRQVSGLEYEVEQKQAIIDSGPSAGCAVGKIKESDLLKTGQKTEVKSALVSPPAITCPACDCTAQITEAKSTGRLEGEEAARRSSAEASYQNQARDAELQRVKAELASARTALSQREALATKLQTQLGKASAEQQEVQAKDKEVESAHRELASLRESRDGLEEERESLVLKIESLQKENETLRARNQAKDSELRAIQASYAQAERSRASEAAEPASRPAEIRAAYNSGRSGARDAALDSFRGRIGTSLNQIQGLVNQRDRLYQAYMNSNRVVNFTPAQARASNGMTISQIRSESENAQTVRELALLTRAVSEIRSKIEFDIGMMERMRRLRSE